MALSFAQVPLQGGHRALARWTFTHGIKKHIEYLKYMFAFAPDNWIAEHPVGFGKSDDQWAAVIGSLEGTFTKPMIVADGRAVQTTGKSYHINGYHQPLEQGKVLWARTACFGITPYS